MSPIVDDAFLARLEAAAGVAPTTLLPASQSGRPLPLVTPTDEACAAQVMRLCTVEGARLLPLGLGSKLHWAPAAAPAQIALSTRGLAGVVAHEPADGTVTALAGTTLGELAAVVGKDGGAVTPHVEDPDAATLGGVLSSGQEGLDRLRHGPPRDHILGARLLLSDGTIVKSGGRLVKNVTGYDLHRLICGANGTLALLLEATLRLLPAPQATAHIQSTFADLDSATDAALTHARGAAPPQRVLIRPTGDAWQLVVTLSASHAEVEELARDLMAALPDATRIEGASRQTQRAAYVIVSTRPSAVAGAVERAQADCQRAGLATRVASVEPCLGRFELDLTDLATESALAATQIRALATLLESSLPAGSKLAWRLRRSWDHAPAAVDDGRPATRLSDRIRVALDPAGTLVQRRVEPAALSPPPPPTTQGDVRIRHRLQLITEIGPISS